MVETFTHKYGQIQVGSEGSSPRYEAFVRHSDYEALRAELEQVKWERDNAQKLADSNYANICTRHRQIEDLTTRAEAAERLAGARVKALEWHDKSIAIMPYYAECDDDGRWRYAISAPKDCSSFTLKRYGAGCGEYPTLDEAKAAAQADYERRILSALAEPAREAGPVADDGSMTAEEIRLENLKQMAKYDGPIVSFEVRDPYYLASCNNCGWVGSTERCGTDSWGDDSDVYCPRCHASGADCGKVADKLTAPPDASAIREALEPFARLADEVFRVDGGREMNSGKPDDASIWGFDRATITYGDLRRVRSALAGAKP